jgi:hypothetical protein
MNNVGQAAACLYCATQLQAGNPEKHLKQCEEWWDNKKSDAAFQGLADLSVAEKRILAMISLEQNPNFSDRECSIGGYLKKEGSNPNKKLSVPYNFKGFEEMAFPILIGAASGFKGSSRQTLNHYTMMRLYSADKAWRQDWDFVVFSIFRQMAYGLTSPEVLQQLPPPVPLAQCDKAETAVIKLS